MAMIRTSHRSQLCYLDVLSVYRKVHILSLCYLIVLSVHRKVHQLGQSQPYPNSTEYQYFITINCDIFVEIAHINGRNQHQFSGPFNLKVSAANLGNNVDFRSHILLLSAKNSVRCMTVLPSIIAASHSCHLRACLKTRSMLWDASISPTLNDASPFGTR